MLCMNIVTGSCLLGILALPTVSVSHHNTAFCSVPCSGPVSTNHPQDVSAQHASFLDTFARLHLLRARTGTVAQLLLLLLLPPPLTSTADVLYVAERAALQCGCGAVEGTQHTDCERYAVRVSVLWGETRADGAVTLYQTTRRHIPERRQSAVFTGHTVNCGLTGEGVTLNHVRPDLAFR